MDNVKIGSNRSFGLVFFVVFLLIGLYPLTNGNEIILSFLVFSAFFLVLGLLNSRLLSPLNKLWFRFGILLGKIISPLIMAIIFFSVVTPIGLIMRLFNKDILNLKYNKEKSYWVDKNGLKIKMKNQF